MKLCMFLKVSPINTWMVEINPSAVFRIMCVLNGSSCPQQSGIRKIRLRIKATREKLQTTYYLYPIFYNYQSKFLILYSMEVFVFNFTLDDLTKVYNTMIWNKTSNVYVITGCQRCILSSVKIFFALSVYALFTWEKPQIRS